MATSVPSTGRSAGAGVFLALALLSGGGCVSHPQEINGHRVTGTRWVNGHVVYVLADSEADQQRMQDSAKEADAASRAVVFRPLRPKKPAN